jgi:hypothetical protein
MKELMPFSKFKLLMNVLLEFQQKKDKISNFFEKELMENSWCIITFGDTVESALINLMADEFECWYTFKDDIKEFDWWQAENKYGMENDIETWLYSLDEHKSITVNGKEIDISSIESFYDFLVSQYKEKHNLTSSDF